MLTLTYGTMSAGKSTMVLQLAWQLRQTRGGVEVWTFGDRSGSGKVTSRVGLESEAVAIAPGEELSAYRMGAVSRGVRVLIIDEVQFASAKQVDQLAFMVDECGIDVHCFGLGADFLLDPFEGTARLFALADEVRELPVAAYCWCGERGRCNARVVGGTIQRAGDQHLIGDTQGDIRYQVLCRRHYRTGELG
jgi:thymidine kinase